MGWVVASVCYCVLLSRVESALLVLTNVLVIATQVSFLAMITVNSIRNPFVERFITSFCFTMQVRIHTHTHKIFYFDPL